MKNTVFFGHGGGVEQPVYSERRGKIFIRENDRTRTCPKGCPRSKWKPFGANYKLNRINCIYFVYRSWCCFGFGWSCDGIQTTEVL